MSENTHFGCASQAHGPDARWASRDGQTTPSLHSHSPGRLGTSKGCGTGSGSRSKGWISLQALSRLPVYKVNCHCVTNNSYMEGGRKRLLGSRLRSPALTWVAHGT